uniref:Uncharacterized protein n=1 Tax=Parascaris univalens TaxID=6257 RepID=A0A915A8W4_PARUN
MTGILVCECRNFAFEEGPNRSVLLPAENDCPCPRLLAQSRKDGTSRSVVGTPRYVRGDAENDCPCPRLLAQSRKDGRSRSVLKAPHCVRDEAGCLYVAKSGHRLVNFTAPQISVAVNGTIFNYSVGKLR